MTKKMKNVLVKNEKKTKKNEENVPKNTKKTLRKPSVK